MTATLLLKEVHDFTPNWKLTVDGRPISGDWRVESNFGSVHTAVVLDKDGRPVFDRPAYREAPNVNIVAWGRTKRWFGRDSVRIAVIRQPRPHADDPENPGDDHAPVVFGQLPMGFLERVLGESGDAAARRETTEETGASAIIQVTRPKYPLHNPNPTFVATWSDLYFVEVDLKKIDKLKSMRSEPIYSAEYVSAAELIRHIREGKDEKDAVYRMCTANSLWMIFFATYPELWPY